MRSQGKLTGPRVGQGSSRQKGGLGTSFIQLFSEGRVEGMRGVEFLPQAGVWEGWQGSGKAPVIFVTIYLADACMAVVFSPLPRPNIPAFLVIGGAEIVLATSC